MAAMAASIGLPALSYANDSQKSDKGLSIHIFSKHLQFLDYDGMAEAAAEIGFDGVDLSVRPKGHVLPENVTQDLPLAVESLQKVGFQPKLMASGITSVKNEYTEAVLRTAANLGFQFYRLGYYRYSDDHTIPKDLALIQKELIGLAALNKRLGIKAAFQNHAGSYVGASIWEIWELLKDNLDDFIGCQYDIRHATVEGGQSWPTGLRLITPKINSIVLKDYKWQQEKGKWSLLNVPIGEGMVDFKAYFALLKKHQINVPVSMHCEYDLGGAEHGERKIAIPQAEVFKAMKKDLDKVRELWENA